MSIQAGQDHLVALTSKGRVYSLPVSVNANSHGQLGLRHVSVAKSIHPLTFEAIELNPKVLKDPYATSTPYTRQINNMPIPDFLNPSPQPSLSPSAPVSGAAPSVEDDTSIRFATTLHEVPSLCGIQVSQAVAGGRSTYVRTEKDGRVLAWGANEYG